MQEQPLHLLLHLLSAKAGVHDIKGSAYRAHPSGLLRIAAIVALQRSRLLMVRHGHGAVRALEPVEKQNHLLSSTQSSSHFKLKGLAKDAVLVRHVRNLDLWHTTTANAGGEVYARHARGILHQVPSLKAWGCASHKELSMAVRNALLGNLPCMVARIVTALV